MLYLSGVSNEWTRAAQRPDLGLLGTPAGSTWKQKDHYPVWAADNGCFVETKKPGSFDAGRWIEWLAAAGPELCLWATLPDVLCNHRATWERSVPYIEPVSRLGFRIAVVLQDGLTVSDPMWDEILCAADCVFVGGSTEWKLGPDAADLVAAANDAERLTHVGRVNSRKRLRYAASIGADTADGTYLNFGDREGRRQNTERLLGWLDELNGGN